MAAPAEAATSSWASFAQGRQPLDSPRATDEVAVGPIDDVLAYGEARHNARGAAGATPSIVRWGSLDDGANGAAVPVTITRAAVTATKTTGPTSAARCAAAATRSTPASSRPRSRPAGTDSCAGRTAPPSPSRTCGPTATADRSSSARASACAARAARARAASAGGPETLQSAHHGSIPEPATLRASEPPSSPSPPPSHAVRTRTCRARSWPAPPRRRAARSWPWRSSRTTPR